MRGVETFDTEEVVVLVQSSIEEVAAEFIKRKGALRHERDIFGEEIKITDPSYLVLRLAEVPWTLIAACTSSPKNRLEVSDAAALSKALHAKAIFFGNSDCASYTEYELFDTGKSQERFQCADDVSFTSSIRQVPAPEDGPEIYEFVNAFFGQQDAFLPPLSIELGTGSLRPGKTVVLAEDVDELDNDIIERVDYISVS